MTEGEIELTIAQICGLSDELARLAHESILVSVDRDLLLRALSDAGLTYRQIASAVRLSEPRVSQCINRVKGRPGKWPSRTSSG